jgi:hypothetical protein
MVVWNMVDVTMEIRCKECGRGVYGFWKYMETPACSKVCYRRLIAKGEITRLIPEREYPELGILPIAEVQNG